jgi:hypothetical protein
MTKRERSSRPDRPSLERSLDALLDRSLLDRSSLDRDWRDSGSLDPGALDCASLDSVSLDRVSLDRAALGRGSLGRGATPDDDPARWQPVAQVLAALTSAPESSELTGEARALAEFRAFSEFRAFADVPARGADLPPPAPRRDPGRRTWLPRGRLAVAAATSAVLMGGLLALAYAGDLPMAAQRLAHDTINAPDARPDPEPAASSHPAESPTPAGSAVHQATHALVRPDRQVHSGSVSGHPRWPGSYRFPSGSPSGRQGQSGRPGRSAEPWPSQAPWPSASISPPASATPSPSAVPSQSGPPSPEQSPSSPQSTPP